MGLGDIADTRNLLVSAATIAESTRARVVGHRKRKARSASVLYFIPWSTSAILFRVLFYFHFCKGTGLSQIPKIP